MKNDIKGNTNKKYRKRKAENGKSEDILTGTREVKVRVEIPSQNTRRRMLHEQTRRQCW